VIVVVNVVFVVVIVVSGASPCRRVPRELRGSMQTY